ncbi:hypothetical protein [Tenacibaculum amylolyticum]|uniref:hypothetical protein n=1 Tax=Tenacibaculum amylolyticum TaxID=104269 RepID=UPI0038950338
MHKKLASDLTSLAHSILQMKNKEDVLALKEKAHEVYEKLALLAYVEEYINTTPQATVTKEELIEKIAGANVGKVIEEGLLEEKESVTNEAEEEIIVTELVDEEETITPVEVIEKEVTPVVEEPVEKEEVEVPATEQPIEASVESIKETTEEIIVHELFEEEEEDEVVAAETKTAVEETPQKTDKKPVTEITEQPFDELEQLLFAEDITTITTEEEFVPVEEPKAEEIKEEKPVEKTPTLEDELQDTLPVDVMADLFQKAEPKKTVNDYLQNTIQIGLNDRIAFVNNLFDGDQTDFNRVVSQLNTFKTEKEAKSFINKMVKPDYDWSEKEEYETRFLEIIERRFS